MTCKLDREHYASIYGTSVRSVGNYEREDAPLDDPAAMYDWLWSRRHQPPAFSRMSKEQVVNAYLQRTAVGEARGDVVIKAIDDLLTEIDADQNIVRCKLVTERQKHTAPVYAAVLFDCLNRIAAAVQDAQRAIGTHVEDVLDDLPDEDDEEGTEDHAVADTSKEERKIVPMSNGNTTKTTRQLSTTALG